MHSTTPLKHLYRQHTDNENVNNSSNSNGNMDDQGLFFFFFVFFVLVKRSNLDYHTNSPLQSCSAGNSKLSARETFFLKRKKKPHSVHGDWTLAHNVLM